MTRELWNRSLLSKHDISGAGTHSDGWGEKLCISAWLATGPRTQRTHTLCLMACKIPCERDAAAPLGR